MASSVTVPKHSMQESCDPSAQKGTPPDSHIGLALTPPASAERRQPLARSSVENVLAAFRDLKNYRSPPQDEKELFELQPDQYLQLLRELECDRPLQAYVDCKVRWEYDPESALLYIRMNTPIHQFFAASIMHEICKQLDRIASGEGAASKFASQIASGASARIFLKEGSPRGDHAEVFPRRAPDAQFHHYDAAYPGVVLEVSYSQNAKELRKLAWQYIQNSNGNIKVFIGIIIDYTRTKVPILSLWRPSYTHEEGEEFDLLDVYQEIESQPFRAQDGSYTNQTQCIQLSLSDFAPDELSANFQDSRLEISYNHLASFLDLAEKAQERESGIYI
ncbi:hypothetical protein BJX99DRAFT_228413 [Aspergillus californicus]